MLKTYSFPPLKRIRERHDFQKTFRRGKRVYSPFFVLYYRRNDLNHGRLGVITSKRNVRKAVQRNQVKRVAREVFRLEQFALKGIDMVLVAQRKANDVTKKELEGCLRKLFIELKS